MDLVLDTAGPDVVSLQILKTALRISGNDEDGMLNAMLPAAHEMVAGYLGRSLTPTTWSAYLDRFPCGELRLPKPPLRSVTSISVETAGGPVALEGFRTLTGGTGNFSRLAPAIGKAWPVGTGAAQSIRVVFVAGWNDADRPKAISAAIILQVSHLRALAARNLFVRREEVEGIGSTDWTVSPAAGDAVAAAVKALITRYKVWF